MTDPQPAEEPSPAELAQAEADRWGWAAEALVNGSNAVEEAAMLLSHRDVAEAFDTVRTPSPDAETNRAELASIANRLSRAAASCRDRQTAALARIKPEEAGQ